LTPSVTEGAVDARLKSGLPAGFDPNIWEQSPKINNGYPYLVAHPPQSTRRSEEMTDDKTFAHDYLLPLRRGTLTEDHRLPRHGERRDSEVSVPADVVVKAGEFKPGHQWAAGKFSLCLSIVGNLELRDTSSGSLLWQSRTSGATKLAMQEDGNLVVYAPDDKPLWASGTNGNPMATLRFQQDGNIVIYSANGESLWATNTYGERQSGM